MWYTRWAPDRDLNPQYAGIPDVERWGAIIAHPRPDGAGQCSSGLTFDGEAQRLLSPDRPKWMLVSAEPPTLQPSVLCMRCGDHGFVTEGRWVPA
jgi:hypothetical protein